jgi:poly-gamma-glutamate capsule biosynthesis protein CapA/YwtB (metallophosphatase superfamily)
MRDGMSAVSAGSAVRMFLCGDLMTGRGIDQILPFPGDPVIYEPYLRSAKDYVRLAEERNGVIPKPVNFSYVWGDALFQLDRVDPDVRLINLETSVTESREYWSGKQIQYKMNPKNIPCITAAKIDCCSLANNHVLDWGYSGLEETLETLRKAGLKFSGAGRNIDEAKSLAMLEVENKGRVVVFSLGSATSGVMRAWAASEGRSGVNFVDLSESCVLEVKKNVDEVKAQGDVVVASVHWGSNWGYGVPEEQREFAHGLIDVAGVDLVYGHSSHHPKALEVYKGKLILYGCGDFLNDYEGIGGFEQFRGDLCLMYFVDLEVSTGMLLSLEMVPMQIRRFRLNNVMKADALWLGEVLEREVGKFGCHLEMKGDNMLSLKWS